MDRFESASRIYVDSNIWVYFIEANPEFVEKVRRLFAAAQEAGAQLFTSELAPVACVGQFSRFCQAHREVRGPRAALDRALPGALAALSIYVTRPTSRMPVHTGGRRQRSGALAYARLFDSGEIEITPLDGGLAKRAAVNGGQLGLKLIDAIHYMSALEWACDIFLTSDSAFKSGPMTEVIMIGTGSASL